jgi:hypothetical protein
MPESIHYLLLFIEQLTIVGEVLPFASPAYTKVLTKGIGTLVGIAMVLDHPGLHIPSLFPEYLEIHHITWNSILYKYHNTIDPCDGFAFGADVFNAHFLKER